MNPPSQSPALVLQFPQAHNLVLNHHIEVAEYAGTGNISMPFQTIKLTTLESLLDLRVGIGRELTDIGKITCASVGNNQTQNANISPPRQNARHPFRIQSNHLHFDHKISKYFRIYFTAAL